MKLTRFSVVMAAFVMALFVAGNAHALFAMGKYTSVEPKDGVVTIQVDDVDDGEAHYYSLEKGGFEVKFFLLKSSDGVIRAAFDACDVCFREKKGYDQDGEFMVCNNCGMRFQDRKSVV